MDVGIDFYAYGREICVHGFLYREVRKKIYPKDSFDNQYVQLLSFSKIEKFLFFEIAAEKTNNYSNKNKIVKIILNLAAFFVGMRLL